MIRIAGSAALLLALAACEATDRAAAVKIPLPPDGAAFGSPSAPVTLLEIGTAECPACMVLHEVTYGAGLADYLDRGRVRLRYVDLSRTSKGRAIGGYVDCISRTGPDPEQLEHFVDAFTAHDARAASTATGTCGGRLAERRALERRVAEAAGTRVTPTLVVGYQTTAGSVIGWPMIGVPSWTELRARIDSALLLLDRRKDGHDGTW